MQIVLWIKKQTHTQTWFPQQKVFLRRILYVLGSVSVCVCFCLRDEWTEAIQMVADKLQRQEEERIQCSPTSQIDNIGEEEMDISISHHKRKVQPHHLRCFGWQ